MPKGRHTIRTELAVIGGGLSGLAFAVACADAGIAVTVIDRAPPATYRNPAFDGRTTAIAYGSQQVLAGIGVWNTLAPVAEPIREIRVVDGGSPLFLHYDSRDVAVDALGYIVENRHLHGALQARAAALPHLRLLAPAVVTAAAFEEAGVTLTLEDGRQIVAALAVGADGRHSPMRAAAGIKARQKSYHQTAIVCTVRHALPHEGVAVEHFRSVGPFAILPMQRDRSSIVWTEEEHTAPAILALDDEGFAAQLASRFGDYLGEIAVEGARWSYPLMLIEAERFTAQRLALIGDAAHVIHPIAGQGWNLGVRDIAALAELVVDAHRLGLDLGSSTLLRRYETWRRFDAMTLIAATDGLNRLFSYESRPVRLARDLGLAAVNRAPALKRFFMRQAMGVVGDLPRLVKGEAL